MPSQNFYARCIKQRNSVFLLLLVVAGLFATGLGQLSFSNSYRMFFSDANPELQAFDSFLDDYSRTDTVLFVIHNPNDKVLNTKTVKAISTLTNKAWQLPFASRVDSITNFQYTQASGDELEVGELFGQSETFNKTQILEKQSYALNEPLLVGRLISPDAKTVAVSVTVKLPLGDLTALPKLVDEARALRTEFLQTNPELEVALSGVVMLNHAFAEASKKDLLTLAPIMYGLLILMTFLALRSFWASIATLLIIAGSSLVTLGASGFLKIPLSPVSVAAPSIVMTLAIADSIHILSSFMLLYRQGMGKQQAIIESLKVNTMPVTLTSLTTVIGFLSLNFSDAPPFWHLGNLTAVGIVAAWALSLVFLPAFLAAVPLKPSPKKQTFWEQTVMHKLALWVSKRAKWLLVAGVIISVGLIQAINHIELSDQFIDYFGPDIPFRQDADFTAKHLSGIYVLEYSMPANTKGGVNEPNYLQKLEAFTTFLKTEPLVNHVYSYTPIIKRLNQNMHGDNADFYRIPETREQAAQYRLLYEFSLPFGHDLSNRINHDKSASRVTVIIDNISSKKVHELTERIGRWQQQNLPSFMVSPATGTTIMFSHISKRNIDSMMRGNLLAIVLISLIMLVVLKSARLGFVSLLANSLPILMMFGVWGLLVGKVGMVASTVAAATLGIVVDDTVHFLSKYQYAMKHLGKNSHEALVYTFETVGVAIVSTTVILISGFSVLAFSDFELNLQTGLMSAITIGIALLFDLLLLPALLLITKKKT